MKAVVSVDKVEKRRLIMIMLLISPWLFVVPFNETFYDDVLLWAHIAC